MCGGSSDATLLTWLSHGNTPARDDCYSKLFLLMASETNELCSQFSGFGVSDTSLRCNLTDQNRVAPTSWHECLRRRVRIPETREQQAT